MYKCHNKKFFTSALSGFGFIIRFWRANVWEKGKKVYKATAVRCYQCFSLRLVRLLLSKAKQLIQKSYSGQLLTAPDRNKSDTHKVSPLSLNGPFEAFLNKNKNNPEHTWA